MLGKPPIGELAHLIILPTAKYYREAAWVSRKVAML